MEQHERIENLGVPSVNRVLRQLKRQEHSMFNCVASVVADAVFVQEVRLRVIHSVEPRSASYEL